MPGIAFAQTAFALPFAIPGTGQGEAPNEGEPTNRQGAAAGIGKECTEHNMQGFNPHEARIKTPNPYLTMMGLYLGGFTGMFSETSLNIALPQLSAAFGVETAVMQWMVVGYMLVIGIVLPFASLLMKWFSVRKLTLFALGAFFVGSVISGAAPSFEIMLAGRLVQGIGTGLILPMMFAVVLEVFPPVKIGAVMGLTALIIMFAPAIGPTLSGILLGAFSWRAIFFAFAVVLAVAMVFGTHDSTSTVGHVSS